MIDPEGWLGKAIVGAIGAISTWAVWMTVKVFGLEKDMITRGEHEDAMEQRHAENVRRFDKLDEKQDEMMRLLIDVIRQK